MSVQAIALWNRAGDSLRGARLLLDQLPDLAASRAYYAAFYAVSAWLTLQGREFRRHTAVEAAVHRDLVHEGLWPDRLGEEYSRLVRLRHTGDYGVEQHVEPDAALRAINVAADIVEAVAQLAPEHFSAAEDE